MNNIVITLIIVIVFIIFYFSRKPDINKQEAQTMLSQGAHIIDARSPGEYAGGCIDGAVNIPHTDIVAGIAKLNLPKDAPIILYCASGMRSGSAARALKTAGYTNAHNAGGMGQAQQMLAGTNK